MIFNTVSADQMRAAQLISGVTMVIWISVGVLPPLRPYAHAVRRALLLLYLASCVGFIVFVLAGRGS